MATTIIDNGVDVCKPIPCHSTDKPEILIQNYPDTLSLSEVIAIKWDIIGITSSNEVTSNVLKWSTDPFNVDNIENPGENAPFQVSFNAPENQDIVYFRVSADIDNVSYRSELFSIVVSSATSSSSSSARVEPTAIESRIS
tara:strand:- start:166 stop:588 length:423 start_codon:yes stop_codon:yes gene_type:complete